MRQRVLRCEKCKRNYQDRGRKLQLCFRCNEFAKRDGKRMPLKEFAYSLRRLPTRCEALLHNELLIAFAPYRATIHTQHIIGPYIADFLISPGALVVEVDGPTHIAEKDRRRDTYMHNLGYRIARYTNQQVRLDARAVAQKILALSEPLQPKEDAIKVTTCPPGSAIKAKHYYR